MIKSTELQNMAVTSEQIQDRCQEDGSATIEAIEHGERGGEGHDIGDPASRDQEDHTPEPEPEPVDEDEPS